MARPEKVAVVDQIKERFEDADATLLTEYRGLRVAEIADVRTALREAGAEYKVLKNTLARIAVREVGLEDLVEMLEGPTAVVFVQGDVAAAAKALDDATKKYPVLVVKGGALKGKIFDAAQAQALARIEPREVLLAKIAMLANAPAQQTANVLSALLRNLGSMLAQVVTQKEAGGGDETVTPEEVGVPSPEADTAEGKEESAADGAPTDSAPAESATTDSAPIDSAETPEAQENEASEPPTPDTEEPDPAQEAAEEASAGEAAAPISSTEDEPTEEDK